MKGLMVGRHHHGAGGLIRSVYLPPPARQGWSLAELFGPIEVRYFALGRFALEEALRTARITGEDSVLLPALICRDIVPSISRCGARPRFYPVNRQLGLAVPPSQLPPARAILAVNYFGFPQPLEALREYCRQTGAVLIEDNAHGLLSRDEQGNWLGLRGDLGIFSLRKTLPLPNGGALAIPRISPWHLSPQITFDFDPPPLRYRLKQRLRRVVPWLGHRPVRFLSQCARSLQPLPRGPWKWIGLAKPRQHLSKPSAFLAKPLRIVDPEQEVSRRRALYPLVNRMVVSWGGRPVFLSLPAYTVPYGVPFYAQGAVAHRIRRRLAREGFDCVSWPELPDLVFPGAPEHYRTLWYVPFLW